MNGFERWALVGDLHAILAPLALNVRFSSSGGLARLCGVHRGVGLGAKGVKGAF
jgi:hypothetical protein